MVWLCRLVYIILDIIKWWYWDESRSKDYRWTNFFNFSLKFKQYFSPQFYQNFLLTAYILVHNFDIICLSDTYLNSIDDKNLEIPNYYLLRADHPSNNKRGGVCIFYRNNLPLGILIISYLSECIFFFKISIGNKICRFIHLYRFPSQTQDELNQI